MTLFNPIIKFILIFLIIFTPIAFGSMEVWAFSLMENRDPFDHYLFRYSEFIS